METLAVEQRDKPFGHFARTLIGRPKTSRLDSKAVTYFMAVLLE
jgi:hypothetical protein